jgi:hypothetical protein
MSGINRYCIPLDGGRQPAEAELKFFKKGTGTGEPLSMLFMISNNIGISPIGGYFHQI